MDWWMGWIIWITTHDCTHTSQHLKNEKRDKKIWQQFFVHAHFCGHAPLTTPILFLFFKKYSFYIVEMAGSDAKCAIPSYCTT
ncbi:hypothetical protein XENTR_v10010032 [Xenopus tropicalis]|nr:hypothetical protein XENTR_v10010032 [Xenopus tropicalis]